MPWPIRRRTFRVTVLRHYSGRSRLPRHRHLDAYAAVVLDGDFVEAGDRGRHRPTAGKVVFHRPFEAHQDEFGRAGAVVLDLPLSRCPGFTTGELDTLDALVRLADRDPRAAAKLLLEDVRFVEAELADWPDALARALASEPEMSLTAWAEQNGLTPQAVSRDFRQAYGTTAKRFRAEQRAQQAVHALAGWTGTLAGLAAEVGFVDQAHLTHAVVSLTGSPPGRLRGKWIQDRRGAAG
jgi:AraC-like DNA-binding protein